MTSVSPDSSSIADTYTGRAVPWSQEAEQAVLGAMLLDQDAALLATELVQDDMFYRESHRRLFRAMVGLVERRTVIDPVTLRDEAEDLVARQRRGHRWPARNLPDGPDAPYIRGAPSRPANAAPASASGKLTPVAKNIVSVEA